MILLVSLTVSLNKIPFNESNTMLQKYLFAILNFNDSSQSTNNGGAVGSGVLIDTRSLYFLILSLFLSALSFFPNAKKYVDDGMLISYIYIIHENWIHNRTANVFE